MLDPFKPHLNNNEIIKDLLTNSNDINGVFNFIKNKGGRYVVFLEISNRFIVLNDAMGFRQIFYYKNVQEKMLIASQPSLIGKLLNIDIDEEYKNDLLKIDLFKEKNEYWFPGSLTLYDNVFHLMPNHFLDISTSKVERFWPDRKMNKLSLNECVIQSSDIIKGSIKSASNRYKLAFGISAGIDSRVILAAVNDIKKDIYYFTHTHQGLNENGDDIKIPGIILKQNRLPHNIINYINDIPEKVEEIFKKNVTYGRINKLANAFSIMSHFKETNKDFLVMNGNGSEVGRSFYKMPFLTELNSNTLSILIDMNKSQIVNRNIGLWIKEFNEMSLSKGNILNLFYWEHRMGSWAAMTFDEYDIAFESFSPFNNRQLMELFMSIKGKYRFPPEYKLHKELIDKMWPELLDYPFNLRNKNINYLINIFKKTKIYGIYLDIKYYIKLLFHGS